MADQDAALRWLVDRAEIAETVYLYATGIDTRDFELFRSIFTDEVGLDFGSFSGGPVEVLTLDQWIGRLRRVFPGFDATQHSLSNPRITVDGDRATCIVYMQAEHFLANDDGDGSYAVGGYYTDELVRTPGGWRISKVALTVLWHRGNAHIMTLARRRATEGSASASGSGSS